MQAALAPIIGPAKPIVPDLTGRVAIVTGGALGIGYEVSRHLALAGCRVIMINRKEEQGAEAIEKLKKESDGKAKVEWTECDLGDLKMVKSVFSKLAKEEERLDLLICSAGINTNTFGLDADGIDRHFGVNWLGHFYLINLLFPLLRKTSKLPHTPPPRIVFESSEMHRFAPKICHFGSLEEINDEKMDPTNLYGRTKLAMILGTKYGIVEKVIKPNKDDIYAIAVHPGAVNTDIQKQWEDAYPGLFGKAVRGVTEFFGRSPEQGSYSALYAATSDEIVEKGWNGVYLNDPGMLGKETEQASDEKLGYALWDLSTRLVKEKVGEDALGSWDA